MDWWLTGKELSYPRRCVAALETDSRRRRRGSARVRCYGDVVVGDALSHLDWFACMLFNGLPAQSFKDFLGEARLKEFINFVLAYLSTVDIPVKRCAALSFDPALAMLDAVDSRRAGEKNYFLGCCCPRHDRAAADATCAGAPLSNSGRACSTSRRSAATAATRSATTSRPTISCTASARRVNRALAGICAPQAALLCARASFSRARAPLRLLAFSHADDDRGADRQVWPLWPQVQHRRPDFL